MTITLRGSSRSVMIELSTVGVGADVSAVFVFLVNLPDVLLAELFGRLMFTCLV